MNLAVRVIFITALLLEINLLSLGSEQDSLREAIRQSSDADVKAMLYLKLSDQQKNDRFNALKEAENIFISNKNNEVGIETYLRLGDYYLSHADADSAVFYLKNALSLSELLKNRFYIARCNQELGKYSLQQGSLPDARQYAVKAKDIYLSLKDTAWLLKQINFIAGLEAADGRAAKAKQLYNEVWQKGIKPRDNNALATAGFGLAKIFIDVKNYNAAFTYLKTSRNIWEKTGNKEELAGTLNELGSVYLAIGLDSLAFTTIQKALNLNTDSNPNLTAEANLNLTAYYLNNNDFDEALNSVNIAIEKSNVAGNTSLNLKSIIKKADILCRTERFAEAKNLIDGALKIADKNNMHGLKAEGLEVYSRILLNVGDTDGAVKAAADALEEARTAMNPEQIQKNAFMLGKLMNSKGQFVSASRYLLLSNQYKDSLTFIQRNGKLRNAVFQYELASVGVSTKTPDSVNTQKSSILSRAGATNRVQNLLVISIALLVILISFFSILVFKGYRSNKKLYNDLNPGSNEINNKDELEKLAVLNNKIFSVISHDLRSPIVSIKDSIDFLRQEGLDEETKQEALILSEELTEATLNLLDNLLGWAKNQKKRVDPKKTEIKILDEIKQIEYLYKASLSKKEISLTIDCNEGVIALADNELINIALRNLVSNAIKFTPRGGSIHISGEAFNDKILVMVKDNGIGISKEDQSKILATDSFFSKNGTENESGSGIGLKLVNEYIKIMGGELKIESSPGQGSKFLFSLPAYPVKKKSESRDAFFKSNIN